MTTHLLDPVFHSNRRTEFRIPSNDKVLVSNMRLADFGVVPTANASYYVHSGIYALLKQITLYSNNEVLDQLKDPALLMTMLNHVVGEDRANNIDDILAKTSFGLTTDNTVTARVPDNKLIGRLNLAKIFPLLRAQDVLPKVKDLRLVIEYQSDPLKVFKTANRPADMPDINRPFLIVDELLGGDASGEGSSFTVKYSAYEVERLVVPSITAGTTYNLNHRLRAFDGKMLECLFMMTPHSLDTDINTVSGHLNSVSIPKEKIQLVINGKKFFPLQGITNKQQKLAMTTDSLGQFYTINGSQLATGKITANTETNYANTSARLQLLTQSFLATDIYRLINDLRLEYEATAGTNAFSAFDIYLYGKVERYVVKDKMGNVKAGYVV